MFDDMVAQIREDTMRMILSVMPRPQAEIKREAVAEVTSEQAEGKTIRPASGSAAQRGVVSPDGKTVKKVGRNDLCPCGSGKKYKKCCGRGDNSAE